MTNEEKKSSSIYDSIEVKSNTPPSKPQTPPEPRPNPIAHKENIKNS
ncbi:MAG: hypothetical protein K2P98_06305 [Neisseriaceae bacterium]|nr:hypothetical protein [Neisseriaceae bacterium]